MTDLSGPAGALLVLALSGCAFLRVTALLRQLTGPAYVGRHRAPGRASWRSHLAADFPAASGSIAGVLQAVRRERRRVTQARARRNPPVVAGAPGTADPAGPPAGSAVPTP